MPPPLTVGDTVWVEPVKETGVIRYLGATQFQTGEWVGIELEKPMGRNNGSVAGVQYFQCKEQHGIFVRPHTVSRPPAVRSGDKAAHRRRSMGDAPVEAQAQAQGATPAPTAPDGAEGPRVRRSETLTSIPEESRSNSSSRSNSLVWQDLRQRRTSGDADKNGTAVGAPRPRASTAGSTKPRIRSSSEDPKGGKAMAEDLQKAPQRRVDDLRNGHKPRPEPGRDQDEEEEEEDGDSPPSLEALAAESERAVQTADGRCALTGLVAELRARLRAAAHAEYGAEWERLFRGQDGERVHRLSWDSFRTLCRHALGPGVRDAHLRILFQGLDVHSEGDIAVEELVSFVADPIGRLRTRLRTACQAEAGDDWASAFRSREDEPTELHWHAFRKLCRGRLNLPDDDVQLAFIFRTLDADGSGVVLLDELAAFPVDPATAEKEQVRVSIIGATDLCNTPGARGAALVDPYCTCEVVGKPHTRVKTKVMARTADPTWNHQESISDFTVGESLVFNVWHKNWMTKDVLIGRAKLPSSRFCRRPMDEEVVHLQTVRGIKAQLRIKVERLSLRAAATGTATGRQSAIDSWLSDSSDEEDEEVAEVVSRGPDSEGGREGGQPRQPAVHPEVPEEDEDDLDIDAEADRARRSLQHIVAAKGAAAAAAAVSAGQGATTCERRSLGGDAARLARAEMEAVNLRREVERLRAAAAAQDEAQAQAQQEAARLAAQIEDMRRRHAEELHAARAADGATRQAALGQTGRRTPPGEDEDEGAGDASLGQTGQELLEAARGEAEVAQAEVAKLREELGSLRAAESEAIELRAELVRLREQVAELPTLRDELHRRTAEVGALRAELAQLQAAVAAGDAKADALQAELTQLRAANAADGTQEELRSVRAELESVNVLAAELQREVDRLRFSTGAPSDVDDGSYLGSPSDNPTVHTSEEAWRQFTPRVVNPERCYARTWNGGAGGQCGKKKAVGSDFCEAHEDEESWGVLGRVDGPIPAKKLRQFQRRSLIGDAALSVASGE